MCKISTLPLCRFVKCGKERVEKNLHLLTLDKKRNSLCISLQFQALERKQKETNSAGGEADEVIVMINNGLFCDRSTRGVKVLLLNYYLNRVFCQPST